MRIDPQRLIRLAVLIQQGSFRRAAERLGLTQSALSQSIAQIEKEVGVCLVERTSHGLEPTIYGKMLYEHAKAVDRELTQAGQRIQELALGHKGALRLGVTVGGAASLVALAVCKLLASRPGIDTRLIAEPSVSSLLVQLQDRSLDMLICQRPHDIELKGARSVSLFEVERKAYIRAGHPLTGHVSLRDLAHYPFVCPQEELGRLFGFQQIFSSIGLDLPEVLVSNSIEIAKEIVLHSDAFALFSDLSVLRERRLNLLKATALDVPTKYWMHLIIRSEQIPTDLMKAFVIQTLAVCKELKIEARPDAARFRDAGRPASGQTPREGGNQ